MRRRPMMNPPVGCAAAVCWSLRCMPATAVAACWHLKAAGPPTSPPPRATYLLPRAHQLSTSSSAPPRQTCSRAQQAHPSFSCR